MSATITKLFSNAPIDPETLLLMGEAYDRARNVVHERVASESIANAIIAAVRSGERNLSQLILAGCQAAGESDQKQA